jgi:hypothetical protein
MTEYSRELCLEQVHKWRRELYKWRKESRKSPGTSRHSTRRITGRIQSATHFLNEWTNRLIVSEHNFRHDPGVAGLHGQYEPPTDCYESEDDDELPY